MKTDKSLIGNKLIEDAIKAMYEDPSDEKLTKVLSVIRHRMQDGGHLVVAVKAGEAVHLELRPVRTPDQKKWFAGFTSFDQELKGGDKIVSGFTAEITQLFDLVEKSEEIQGIIINPWDKALKLDRTMIRIIKGS